MTRGQSTPRFAPFTFTWHARDARLLHDAPRQLARYSIYRKCCWIYGCHAPIRGGDLAKCFLAKSADLSDSALAALRTAPPFDAKDFLGSPQFPI